MSDSLSAEERAAELAANYGEVRAQVDEACLRAGRDPADVTLLAVSKTFPAEDVRALAAQGRLDFGESYVQEALPKLEALADLSLRWHFIGRLQTNKAKFVAGRFGLIHGVDSKRLAESLHKVASGRGLVQPVLIQASLAGEEQKGGVEPSELLDLARKVLALPGLRLDGLMTVPPFGDDPEIARPYFARLRRLRDDLEQELGVRLPQLSMGMSDDFGPAVEEGATLVRVGTRIFGRRQGRSAV